MKFLVLMGLFASPFVSTPASAAPRDAGAELRTFLDAEWQRHLVDDPLDATNVGDHRFDRRLPDASFDAEARRQASDAAALTTLRAISRPQLSPADQLNFDLYQWTLQRRIAGYRHCEACMPVSQIDGPYRVLADLVEYSPPTTAQQADDLIARMNAYPAYLDQQVAWLARGMKQKLVAPRIVVQKVPGLIRQQLAPTAEASVLYAPFTKLPSTIPAPERARLAKLAAQAIAERVQPALERFATFIEKTYLPACRDSIGLSALPAGDAWYASAIEHFTTLPLDANAVHELGLAEVARLTAIMETQKREAGFGGTLPQFFEFLRTDPQFFFHDRESLLRGYRDVAKRIDGELPRLFGKLPRLPYGVTPVPAYSEQTSYTAYYVNGSFSDGRAAHIYVNTYDLPARPMWEMEALVAHEGVPGHHLQIALAQEMTDVPTFRRESYIESFGEGWGLYSESLGAELGLYQTPYTRFGQLSYEMWRAVRLVVDTGIHKKGWTRAQAIAFFTAHTGKATHDIEVEVDRYIAWPGQALAYKIGQRKILELRERAQTALGARFDLRRFHDAVLAEGPLPLPLLDAQIDRFIAAEKAR